MLYGFCRKLKLPNANEGLLDFESDTALHTRDEGRVNTFIVNAAGGDLPLPSVAGVQVRVTPLILTDELWRLDCVGRATISSGLRSTGTKASECDLCHSAGNPQETFWSAAAAVNSSRLDCSQPLSAPPDTLAQVVFCSGCV